MERRFSFSLPVTAAVLAIAFVYFCTVFVFINRWFGFLSSPGIMNVVAFTAISAMCVFNYVICVFTDPGQVPASYMPDIEVGSPVHEVERKALSVLLLAPLTVAICILMGWHIYLVLENKTTIEYHEVVRSMRLAQKEGQVYKHPYNIGAYENLSLVLGPVICCRIFPTSGHVGDGLRFPTAYDANAPVAAIDVPDTGIL